MRLADVTTADLLFELETRFQEAALSDVSLKFYWHILVTIHDSVPHIVLTKTREEEEGAA